MISGAVWSFGTICMFTVVVASLINLLLLVKASINGAEEVVLKDFDILSVYTGEKIGIRDLIYLVVFLLTCIGTGILMFFLGM